MLELMKTKTFWVGLLMIAGGVIKAVFDKDYHGAFQSLMEALPMIGLGAAAITGRAAVGKVQRDLKGK